MANTGIFPRTRAGLLAALLLHPERPRSPRELAQQVGTTPARLAAELAALTDQGILRRSRRNRRVEYQANSNCPYFEELQALIAKTAGITDVLREALEPLAERIESAFVHGSIAKGTADAASDIDLFVVGDVTLLELARVLPRAGLRLGRPVNPTLLTPAAFRAKRRRDRFVRTVLDGAKLHVIGGGHALGRSTRGTAG